ncbi:hypothetical protein ACO22_02087, partial [Paracoccidioides brasiliensis]
FMRYASDAHLLPEDILIQLPMYPADSTRCQKRILYLKKWRTATLDEIVAMGTLRLTIYLRIKLRSPDKLTVERKAISSIVAKSITVTLCEDSPLWRPLENEIVEVKLRLAKNSTISVNPYYCPRRKHSTWFQLNQVRKGARAENMPTNVTLATFTAPWKHARKVKRKVDGLTDQKSLQYLTIIYLSMTLLGVLWITLKGHHVHQSCGEVISLKETLQNPTPGNGLSESLVPELPASTPVDFPDTNPRSPAKALHADFNIKLALYPLQKAIWCKKSRLWKSLEPDLLKGSSPIAHSHLDKLPVTPRPIAGNITFHPQEGCVDGRDVSDQDTKVRIFPPEKHKHGVRQKQPVIPNIKVEEVFKRTKQQVLHLSIVSILQLGTVAEARNPDTNVGTNSQDEDDEGNNNRKRKRFKSPDPGRAKQQFACLYHMCDP